MQPETILDVKLQAGEESFKVCNIYQYRLVSTQFQILNLKSPFNLVKVGYAPIAHFNAACARITLPYGYLPISLNLKSQIDLGQPAGMIAGKGQFFWLYFCGRTVCGYFY